MLGTNKVVVVVNVGARTVCSKHSKIPRENTQEGVGGRLDLFSVC